jgi:hypothetical protein
MLNLEDEAVSGSDKPTALPEAKTLEIKVQPTDAIGAPKVQPSEAVSGPAPVKNPEAVAISKKPSFFGRVVRFTARATAVVALCGVAWGAGAFYASGHLPLHFLKASHAATAVQSPGHDELLSTVRQMGEEIRALKASVDSKSATPDAAAASVQGQQASGPTTADLVGRVDKLESDLTSKLSQVNEQLASIQQQLAASHVAAAHPAVATRAPARPKRVERYHDAFDPTHDPAAPGAPRPLGSH